ncbi:MAG: (Fe-S)-binding protein [Caldilineae bacterium]|nr:MAG: (Fe-S)-binding protein [Caldilineae bacterium]
MNQPVQLLVTCLVDAFFPQVGMATVKVLERCGLKVQFPAGQTCCGQPAFNGGLWDDARAMARHTLNVLSATEGPIVLPSASCAEMIRRHYRDLFAGDASRARQAEAVAGRTYELTQFLVDVLGMADVGGRCAGCAVYHPSCHGLRGLNLRSQPHTLLANVKGLTLTELPEAETCCGFGGLFAVKMSDLSGAMLERKLDNIEASGAEMVIATDVSCLMHIGGGLQKRGRAVQTRHIAEVLAGE